MTDFVSLLFQIFRKPINLAVDLSQVILQFFELVFEAVEVVGVVVVSEAGLFLTLLVHFTLHMADNSLQFELSG